jgi:hypothetical protein
MWEALELGAQAERPQTSGPGGGAVISVRAAVDAVSPPRRVRRCEREAATLGVRGQPAGAGTDHDGGLRRLVDEASETEGDRGVLDEPDGALQREAGGEETPHHIAAVARIPDLSYVGRASSRLVLSR